METSRVKKEIEELVAEVLETGDMEHDIHKLSRIEVEHPDVILEVKAYAVLLGQSIQVEDPVVQEAAVTELPDAKRALMARILQALDEKDSNRHTHLRTIAAKLDADVKSHDRKAHRIVEQVEHFWVTQFELRLPSNEKEI